MNLYLVHSCESEWGCYCFARSANRAKQIVAHEMNDEYVNMRYKTLKRGVNIPLETAVTDKDHFAYAHLQRCGFEYKEVDEE